MQSWPAAPIPALPGRGPELRLYDTSDRQVRPLAAGPTATMYVCGITPYDATHLGHAATYLAFDLIQRLWRDIGRDVHYVQNVTDVDDPLFERANRDGLDWRDLAAREVALFREDMAALRILPPREYVAATEAVAEVVELVEKMLASGAAYVVDDADQALAVANGTEFGLGSSVWTTEPEEQERFVNELQAGQVFVNGMVVSMSELPFGGVKSSGFGRELSGVGLHEFCNVKSVWVA